VKNTDLYWFILTAAGTMLVAFAVIIYWQRKTHLPSRSLWVGADLWALALSPAAFINILVREWFYTRRGPVRRERTVVWNEWCLNRVVITSSISTLQAISLLG
jgi:uncharacterized membrane protein YcjF (UPF0283 family)